MAFIEVIDPDRATGKLAETYRKVRGPGGQVDNVLQIHSLRPHSLEGHMALYKSVLHHTGNRLPKWFLEAVGVLVSRLNGCGYCAQHHSAGMRRQLRGDDARFEVCLEQLERDPPGAPFTAAESAALQYARKLTLSPDRVARADIDRVRAAGMDDGQILEVNQVASYFAYANRVVLGLGVTTAGEELGHSPADSDAPKDWAHG